MVVVVEHVEQRFLRPGAAIPELGIGCSITDPEAALLTATASAPIGDIDLR